MELGPSAGEITWRNCLEAADCDYDALCEHFEEYGAWDEDEIAQWDNRTLRAMVIQELAADYRTQIDHPNTDDYRHRFDEETGLIYAYFGL